MNLTLGHTSSASQVCLSCGTNIDPNSLYGSKWDPMPPGSLVALFAEEGEGHPQLIGYLCPECAAIASIDVRHGLLRGIERLSALAAGLEPVEREELPYEEELVEELARRVRADVVEKMDQNLVRDQMVDALITPLIGAGRMYGLSRAAGVEDPLEIAALGLISYKDMQPETAIKFAEEQESEIVELADAIDETSSQQELSKQVIRIIERWTKRRKEEGNSQ